MFGCTNPSLLSEYAQNGVVGSGGGVGVGGAGGAASSASGAGLTLSNTATSTLTSMVSAKLTNIAVVNVKADHVKKMYEEAVMVRKVRHYLAQIPRLVEKNEERLRLISSTLEHSTSATNGAAGGAGGGGTSNTLKRNLATTSASNHRPSPNSSLGGSISSINAALNLSSGQIGISSGNGPLMANKSSLFGMDLFIHDFTSQQDILYIHISATSQVIVEIL